MSAITLRHIEIFHAVMTTGNLTQAAALLHTSQPTISRELARFEKCCGLSLFSRQRGRLHATVQGLRLFEEVQRSWYGLERISALAQSLREFHQGELAIACLPMFAQAFLPEILPPFMRRYPDVNIHIVPQESPQLEEWLSAQRYDLGLTENASPPAGTQSQCLLALNEVCILPPGHPLARRHLLTPEDFQGQHYISLARTDRYRQQLDDLFIQHQIKRRLVLEAHSAACVCALVRAGAGVSIVNPLSALEYAASGLIVRRFSLPVPFTVQLVRPCHRPACAVVTQLCQHIRQCLPIFERKLDVLLDGQ